MFYENLYAHGLDCQIISDFFLANKVAAPMNILYLYLCLYFVLIRDFLHSVFLASWVAAAMNILTGLSFNAWWENRPRVFYDNLYIFTNISSQRPIGPGLWYFHRFRKTQFSQKKKFKDGLPWEASKLAVAFLSVPPIMSDKRWQMK